VAKAAASGDDVDVASDGECRNKLEPVEAISRVRAAMVRVGASGGVAARQLRHVTPTSAPSCTKHRPTVT
jgi:hypothetical protein